MSRHFLSIIFWFILKSTVTQTFASNETAVVFYADIGSNITLPCSNMSASPFEGHGRGQLPFMWIREGKTLHHSHVEQNGSLTLHSVSRQDSGIYECRLDSNIPDLNKLASRIQLYVKSPPRPPVNATVYPSTVLALITWKLDDDDGGYPIKHVTVIYQKFTEDAEDPAWRRTYPEHVGPGMTQLEIYRLDPNTTYRFRVWATNKLGPGDYAEVMALTKPMTDHNGIGSPLLKNSQDFDTRVWVIAVSVVFGTMLVLIIVLLSLSFNEKRNSSQFSQPSYSNCSNVLKEEYESDYWYPGVAVMSNQIRRSG
nr:EOG090X0B8X [Eulimnadia texana]